MNLTELKNQIGEKCVKTVLDNGLEIYILPKSEFTSTYAIFGTKYGSVDTKFSTDGKKFTEVPEGIAHFLEHKLFESEDGDAFSLYAKTGASANAFTSFDRTCYLFSCSDNFYENLDILLGFVQHPYFTEATVNKEQGIIGQEIQMYDDSPGWSVLFSMLQNMYEKNPVKIDIAGTKESIAKITDKLLYNCYETFYNSANMYVCIAGNIDAEKTVEFIKEKTAKMKSVNITRGTFEETDGIVNSYFEKNMSVAMPVFCYGYKVNCSRPYKTQKERITMAAAIDYLVGDCSNLYKELTVDGLINDEFDTEYFTGNNYAALIFSGESNNPREVALRIDSEISKVISCGVDDYLLSVVKKAIYGDAVRRFNNVEEITMHLVDCAVCGFDFTEEFDIIKSITKKDILDSLKLLKKEFAVLSVVNPQQKEN